MNEWILRIITMVVGVVSPEIRTGANQLLDDLEAKAKKTPNPWDDILVGLLKTIMTGK